MDFNFNPILWFVCRLCRKAFPDTDKLKAHKIESHLEDCLKIKCIIFDERLVFQEESAGWESSTNIYYRNSDDTGELLTVNLNAGVKNETETSLPEKFNCGIDLDSDDNVNGHSLIRSCPPSPPSVSVRSDNINIKLSPQTKPKPKFNPYVLLTRLPPQELLSASLISTTDYENNAAELPSYPEPAEPSSSSIRATPRKRKPEDEIFKDTFTSPTKKLKRGKQNHLKELVQFIEKHEINFPQNRKDVDATSDAHDIEAPISNSDVIDDAASDTSSWKSDPVNSPPPSPSPSVVISYPGLDPDPCIEPLPLDLDTETKMFNDNDSHDVVLLVIDTNSVSDNNGDILAEVDFDLDGSPAEVLSPQSKSQPLSEPVPEPERRPDPDPAKQIEAALQIPSLTHQHQEESIIQDKSNRADDAEIILIPNPDPGPAESSTIIEIENNNYSNRRSSRSFRAVQKVNYCETQACQRCNRDFYTVEELEDHERLCSGSGRRRNKNQAILLQNKASKIQNTNLTSKSRLLMPSTSKSTDVAITLQEDDSEIEIVEIEDRTAIIKSKQHKSDRSKKRKKLKYVSKDSEDGDYECPENYSASDGESDVDEINDGEVADLGLAISGTSGYGYRVLKGAHTLNPNLRTIQKPEDPFLGRYPDIHTEAELPLVEWLNLQVKKCDFGDSINKILLDPDPSSSLIENSESEIATQIESASTSASDPPETTLTQNDFVVSKENPITCKLCQGKLISESEVKNHAENCWLHNKTRHVYCTICEYKFNHPAELSYHLRYDHADPNSDLYPSKEIMQALTPGQESAASVEIESESDDPDSDLPETEQQAEPVPGFLRRKLGEWIKKRREKCRYELILLEPDPSKVFPDTNMTNRRKAKTGHAGLDVNVTEAAPIKCKLCDLKLKSELEVKEHVKMCWSSNKKKHVFCLRCGKSSSRPNALQSHIKRKHKHLTYPAPHFPHYCSDCGQGFLSWDELKEHRESIVLFRKNFVTVFSRYAPSKSCFKKSESSCSTGSTLPLDQWLIQQKEQNPRNIILLVPGSAPAPGLTATSETTSETTSEMTPETTSETTNTNTVTVNSATEIKIVDEANPVKCKLCAKQFTAEILLRNHVQRCWLHNKKMHCYCVICDKTLSNSNSLKTHNFRKHEGKGVDAEAIPTIVPSHKCNLCGKCFFGRTVLLTHERKHRGERRFACQVKDCQESFVCNQGLRSHMRRKHFEELQGKSGSKIDTHLCPTCGRSFLFQALLTQHIKRVHLEDKPYKCSHEGCTKAFKGKTELVEHVRSHTGEKPFQCEDCGKAFAREWTFAKHRRFHEGTLNRVQCHLCPRKFPGSWELKNHLKVHEEREKFKCKFCEVVCATKAYLRIHTKTHVGGDSESETGSSSDSN